MAVFITEEIAGNIPDRLIGSLLKKGTVFHVTDIVWDTDGEEVKLPSEVFVLCDDEERVVDLISDAAGFCISSLKMEQAKAA